MTVEPRGHRYVLGLHLAAACKVKDVRQGVSEYFEGFKAPEEAMVYLCESVGPYLTGLSEEPPAVPPPVHPPSAEDVEDMYYGCVEGTVLDKEWANVINNGGMTEFGIWQPRGGWKDSGMSLGAFRCYVRDKVKQQRKWAPYAFP